MIVYFLFLILVVLLELYLVYVKKKNKETSFYVLRRKIELENFFLIVCFTLLFVLFIFRDYTVGTDLKNYLIRFLKIGETPFNELWDLSNHYSFEFGFTLLNKFIYMIFPSTFSFMVVSSFFTLIGFYHFINKFSKNKLLSFYIFFTFSMATNSMNTIRQYMAISLLLFSIDYLLSRDLKKYLIFVILATTIHSSSIIFVVLYPLINCLKFNVLDKKSIYLLLIFVAFFSLGGFEIIKYIMSFTSFAWYLNNLKGSGETMLVLLITIFIFLEYIYMNKSNGQIINTLMMMLGITILLNSVALHIGILERMMRTFIPAIIILIPNSFDYMNFKKNTICLIRIASHIFFLFYFIYIMLTPASSGNTNSYKFINPINLNTEIEHIYEEVYSGNLLN